MPTSVVVSQIIPTPAGAFLVKGTVGGTAHLWKREKHFRPEHDQQTSLEQTPTQLFTEYKNHYDAQKAGADALANQSVVIRVGDRDVTIAFGATPVAEVGYEQLEITATADGVASTVAHVSQKDFIAWAQKVAADFLEQIARLLFEQKVLNVDLNRTSYDYIATISIT